MTFLAGVAPAAAWRNDRVLELAGAAVGIGLGAGPLRLTGTAPNGQRFRIRPRRVWRIAASAAQIEGRELGPVGSSGGAELGDFRIPDLGLFACGTSAFDRLDPVRHESRIARLVERA